MDQITPYVIVSPLTDDQVKTINVNQVLASHEPFQNSRSPSLCPHLEAGKHDAIAGVVGLLIATKAVIVCPCCDYVQKSVPSGLLDALPATCGPLDDTDYPNLLAFMRDADEQLQALLDGDRYYMGLNVLRPNVGQYLKDLSSRFRSKGPTLESVPLALMLTLHNQAPPDSATRRIIIGFINAENVLKPRQHWMGGLYLNAEGDLGFDEALYEKTVWRGKQETYFERIEKGYEQLQSGLKFLHHFQKREDDSSSLPSDIQPLLPIRDLQDQVAHLKRIQPKVEALVEAMEGRTFAQLAANIRPEPSVAIGTQIDQAALPSDESQLPTS